MPARHSPHPFGYSMPLPPALSPDRLPARRTPWALNGLFAIALIFLLKAGQQIFVPIAIALALTFLLAGPVRTLRRHGLPEFLGAGLLVLALIGVVLIVIGTIAAPAESWAARAPTTVAQLMSQMDRLRANLPTIGDPQTPSSVVPTPKPTARPMPAAQPAAPDPIRERIADEGIALTRTVLGQALEFGISAASTVILLYFMLASEHWIVSRTVEAFPRHRTRAMILAAIRRAQREIGHYLNTLILVNAAVGVITGLTLWALGLPNPTLWGTMAASLNFIPYLGPLAMDCTLLLAGVLTFDTVGSMLAPAIAFLAIHATESSLVSPWFIGRRLSLSPVAVFIAVLCMAALWGVAGAVLTIPILVGIRCSLQRVRALRLVCVFLEGGANNAPSQKSLLQRRRGGQRGVLNSAAGVQTVSRSREANRERELPSSTR